MIKVACIGDSITSGFTLLNPRRDSYPEEIEERVSKAIAEGLEVCKEF